MTRCRQRTILIASVLAKVVGMVLFPPAFPVLVLPRNEHHEVFNAANELLSPQPGLCAPIFFRTLRARRARRCPSIDSANVAPRSKLQRHRVALVLSERRGVRDIGACRELIFCELVSQRLVCSRATTFAALDILYSRVPWESVGAIPVSLNTMGTRLFGQSYS